MQSSALSRLSNLNNHINPTKKGGSEDGFGGLIKISPEVSEALSLGKAVVALESTIISHGMPYPRNLEVAKEVEAVVRDNGAVPATIAILDGTPFVGLSSEQLEMLAKLGKKVRKTARRDIAHVQLEGLMEFVFIIPAQWNTECCGEENNWRRCDALNLLILQYKKKREREMRLH